MGLGGNQLFNGQEKPLIPHSPFSPNNWVGGEEILSNVELCGRISRKNGWASRLSDNHHHRPVCYYIHRFIIAFSFYIYNIYINIFFHSYLLFFLLSLSFDCAVIIENNEFAPFFFLFFFFFFFFKEVFPRILRMEM